MSVRRASATLLALALLAAIAVAGSARTSEAAAARPRALFSALRSLQLTGSHVRVHPSAYSAWSADLSALERRLSGPGQVSLGVPDPTGALRTFTVSEHSVMQPALQAAHPEIRTYRGRSADGLSSIALDITPMGFHAFVRGSDGSWYVDPAFDRPGETRTLSYWGAAVPASPQTFTERALHDDVAPAEAAAEAPPAATPGGLVTQRVYRLAFLTDPTYAAYFGSANVLAEKATLVNRIDEVYNDDLATQFVMVNGTDTRLNLDTAAKATGPDGPCGADACFTPAELTSCDTSTLDRNGFVLGELIGADHYDIGHIGLGVSGGGLTVVGGVGRSAKAAGCTGLSAPQGDFYAIDYLAHEMGHQMGGVHTFAGTQGSCAGNGSITSGVEPGSGSSIMAYAGICGQDNLQPHSDPYFSEQSIDTITATTAAAPPSEDEQQSVSFTGLDNGEQFTLSCAGCGTSPTITAPYTASGLSTAINALTGNSPAVTPYDDHGSLDNDGFTVSWGEALDVPPLTLTPVSGAFTSSVGTLVQGGPDTNGGSTVVTADHAPVVTPPAPKTIPGRTPFTLTGSGSDPDGDPLVYTWEQNDPGSQPLTTATPTSGPLFRMFSSAAHVTAGMSYDSPGENAAGPSPSRTFPDLAQVVAGDTNAATGSCPPPPPAGALPQTDTDCWSEQLPTSSYTGPLNFRLTARDLAPTGGGVAHGDLTLQVDHTAGPFLVTSQDGADTAYTAGKRTRVTWSVADTDTPTLATQVRITLSTDGGATFPYTLAAETPNDGTQVVKVPKIATNEARIMVQAVGNYFFDVNDIDFTLSTLRTHTTHHRFLTGTRVRFHNTANTPAPTFTCTLDGKTLPCSARVRIKVAPGTHVYTAAARTTNGRIDPTPSQVVFAAPYRSLVHDAKHVTSIAAVSSGGPGRAAVYLDHKRVGIIRLQPGLSSSIHFARPRSGVVRLVPLSGSARVTGLDLLSRA